jgi:alpha-N-arabinofuranosidase
MNNADRVKAACLAQLVNVIGAIMTERGGPAWRQTIFHPFAQASRFGFGNVLRTHLETDSYAVSSYPKVNYLLSSVLHEQSSGRIVVFALNRSTEAEMRLTVELPDVPARRLTFASELHHKDLKAENTKSAPATVAPKDHERATLEGRTLSAILKPQSWNVFVTE